MHYQHNLYAIKTKNMSEVSIGLNSKEIQLINITSESFKVCLSAQSFESATFSQSFKQSPHEWADCL